jgi:hypothetical protein
MRRTSSSSVGIIGGVVAGVLVVVVLLLAGALFYYCKRRAAVPKIDPDSGAPGTKLVSVVFQIFGKCAVVTVMLVSRTFRITTAILVLSWCLKFLCFPGSNIEPPGKYDGQQGRYFPLDEVKAATNNLAKVIGKGGFGLVYYGELPCGQQVAVKVNKGNATSGQGTAEFVNEVCDSSHNTLKKP